VVAISALASISFWSAPVKMRPAGVIFLVWRFGGGNAALACAWATRSPMISPICCAPCPSRFLVMLVALL
jgi:hypothetical protein